MRARSRTKGPAKNLTLDVFTICSSGKVDVKLDRAGPEKFHAEQMRSIECPICGKLGFAEVRQDGR